MSYVIRTPQGTQSRQFFVKTPDTRSDKIVWTYDRSEAFIFSKKKNADYYCNVAKYWCLCEVVEAQDSGTNTTEKDDPIEAFDRAMGVI